MTDASPTFWQKIRRFLFDFSASDNNRREVEDILITALAKSKTDGDFAPTLKQVITSYEGEVEQGNYRWNHFRRFMQANRRPGDRNTGIRTRAEHLLEDLPRIYGNKKNPTGATPSTSLPQRATASHDAPERNTKTTKEKTNDV